MNIQDFVSETLRQIGDGVVAASTSKGIEISPRPLGGQDANIAVGSLVARDANDGRRLIEFVEFDLSVTVQAKIEGSAGAEIALSFPAIEIMNTTPQGSFRAKRQLLVYPGRQ